MLYAICGILLQRCIHPLLVQKLTAAEALLDMNLAINNIAA